MRKLLLTGFFLIAVGVALGQTPMQLLHTIESPFESDLGSWSGSVKGNGDINGDGYNDIIIAGHPIGSALGRRDVYIYLGGETLSNTPDYIITDPAIPGPHYLFGSSIAYNGDLNGDGYCDLVISEPGYNKAEASGRVHVYYGGPDFDAVADVILYGIDYGIESWGLHFGSNVDISGDFNGDGFSDLATWSMYYGSVENHPQVLKIFLGSANFDNVADATYLFDQSFMRAALIMDGDLNQDGFDDLVIVRSPNMILWGNADLLGEPCELNLPVDRSFPYFFAAKDDATYIVNMKGSVNPCCVECYLSACTTEDQMINSYEHVYYPDAIGGSDYAYFLGDVNSDGNIDLLVTARMGNGLLFQIITTNYNPDSIDDAILCPVQNLVAYPNPAQSSVTIELGSGEHHKAFGNGIEIYNIKGQKVRSIPMNSAAGPGAQIVWDRLDNEGKRCPTGVYLLRDTSNPQIAKKITLVK